MLPLNVKEDVVAQQTSNALSELLMLILLCDEPLLLELLPEVCRYVFLSPGIGSHVFDGPQTVAVHLDVVNKAPSLPRSWSSQAP